MMRPFCKMVVTFGALALLASPAWAQQGRGFGFGGGGAFFLMAPNVQKDLKLSDEQTGKVQDTLREVMEKHREDYAGLRDASPQERQTKMQAISKTVNDEVKKALSLSAEQSKRFDQITLQTRGVQAFLDPSVAEKVKLTDDQKSKIREIGESSRGNRAGLGKDATKEERAEAAKKRLETQRENMTKVQALLTDDQKKAWKELTGDPIEIQFQGLGARRRNNNY